MLYARHLTRRANTMRTPLLIAALVALASPSLAQNAPVYLDSAGRPQGAIGIFQAAGASAAGVSSTATESGRVFKASPGALIDYQVTTSATAGYVMTFNATTIPADGPVTPRRCVSVGQMATVGSSMALIPEAYSIGVVVVFSSTGCMTLTKSATAFFSARVL